MAAVSEGSPEPEALDFPPVRNGVDYLVSVVELLGEDEVSGPPAPRAIKYAVLHLQAAAEVLLKARLLREHWSLVFKDPGQASEQRFREGDFESCGIDDTVRRLRHITGLAITDQEHKALKDLARDRNALQHYGLTHPARAVETRAGNVLDFLVRFLDEVLLPALTSDEKDTVGADMDRIREELSYIRTYLTQRRKRIYGELRKSGLAEHAQHCPECRSMALVVKAGGNRCYFCGMSWPTPYALARSTEFYLTGDQVPDTCPQCKAPTLTVEVSFLNDVDALYRFCYSCMARFPKPTHHGDPVPPRDAAPSEGDAR
ncbi:hypothetical protein [Streptomyces mirabilis]|uniref:hypothetical protein n=1 Tax=Streptomyces mirabilis TaxID=68239 RepID=UPI00365E79C5